VKADTKQVRHQLLRRLVATGEMHTQEELVEALRQEGISVTQATVSRDIVELGLVRTSAAGRVIYALPEAVSFTDSAVARRRLSNLLREIPIAFGESSAMLVVRTFPEIVGTVAGDDTILIALRSAADIAPVRGYLSTMLALSEHE
jgi:transcriptional regulator of arginine metabolism